MHVDNHESPVVFSEDINPRKLRQGLAEPVVGERFFRLRFVHCQRHVPGVGGRLGD